MKFKKDTEGNLIVSPEALQDYTNEVASETAKQIEDKMKLNEPAKVPTIILGGHHTRGAENKNWEKTIKFFRALAFHDFAVLKELSEGTAADGGRLVPTEFATDLIMLLEQYGSARRYSTQVSMKSKTMNLNSLTGKVTAYWVAEKGAGTASQPTYGEPILTAKKLFGLTPWTTELFEDAELNIVQNLLVLFAEAFSKEEDDEYYNGDGTVFTGILDTSLTAVDTVLSGLVSTLTYDDVVDVTNSLTRGQLAGSPGVWHMSRSVLNQFRKIKDSNGQPILVDPKGALPATILGYEVEINEVLPAAGDVVAGKCFAAFGNLKQWSYFGDRRRVTTKILSEATVATINLAEKDEEALKTTERVAILHASPENVARLRTA